MKSKKQPVKKYTEIKNKKIDGVIINPTDPTIYTESKDCKCGKCKKCKNNWKQVLYDKIKGK